MSTVSTTTLSSDAASEGVCILHSGLNHDVQYETDSRHMASQETSAHILELSEELSQARLKAARYKTQYEVIRSLAIAIQKDLQSSIEVLQASIRSTSLTPEDKLMSITLLQSFEAVMTHFEPVFKD